MGEAPRRGRCWKGSLAGLTFLLLVFGIRAASAQDIEADRDRAHEMLREIEKELRSKYYAPSFRGKDLTSVFAHAGRSVDTADSEAQLSGILIKALLDLDDSHTFFIPPPLAFDVDYGFDMGMVGERCLVLRVDAGSLAETDGLRPGMTVLSVEGVAPSRENLWTIEYSLKTARPRKALRMGLMAPGGAAEEKVIRAKVRPRQRFRNVDDWLKGQIIRGRRLRKRFLGTANLGPGVALMKLSSFEIDPDAIGQAFERVKGKAGLILDLRDNPGGRLDVVEKLVGCLFDREVRIGEERWRKKEKPLRAKPQRSRLFGGKLVVLVDAASASAAEITARCVQLEGRGQVIGDRTMGAVMLSQRYPGRQGHRYRFVLYGLSITVADLVMSDGRSLEGVGVVPDEVLLPTGEDLASGRDPVLSAAAARLGVKLDPVAAGKLFADH